jgi:hypothetical protein
MRYAVAQADRRYGGRTYTNLRAAFETCGYLANGAKAVHLSAIACCSEMPAPRSATRPPPVKIRSTQPLVDSAVGDTGAV